MQRCRHHPLACGALLVLAATGWLTTGCSTDGHSSKATSSSAHSSSATSSLAPDAIGISPGGVTTRIDAPAESFEEEYFQACHAAREWMDGHGGVADSQIEPYLGMVQASPTGVAGSWNKRWAELSHARQAAVIVAAQAAARAECG